uniref:Protein piccolo n=1 Tax=Oncorhynchus mykiss TaxID=8022 RepID=A0A8K9XBM6_ONCMY
MFSNFLSGANPLSSVSSAVRGGIFGDNGEVDKQKAGPQHPGSVPGPGNAPQQQQGGLQLQGNGQAGQPAKPSGQQAPAKGEPQQQGPPKGGPQQQGPPKGGPQQQAPQQQGPTKGGPQQQAPQQQTPARGGPQQQAPDKGGSQQQGSPKVGAQPQVSPKGGPQQQGPAKDGPQQQGSPKVGVLPQNPKGPQQQGPAKGGPQQQGSPKVGAQPQGSPKIGTQQHGSPRTTPQQQGSPRTTPQQQGSPRTTPQQQGSPRTTPQQQGSPRTTPQQQGSPKVSAAAQASPKMPTTKETKPPAAQKAEEKKAEQPQQAKVPPSVQVNMDKPPSEPPKGTASYQPSPKAGQSTCPLCKVELNMGSKDPPNYNTCTECKNTVCNLCGFNPMTNVTEVKEWLCLNCQMQRALGGMEPPGPPMIKSQPLPSKVSTPAASLKLTPAPAKPQKEEIPTPAAAQKEIPPPTVPQETLIPAGTPSTAAVKKEETPAPGSPQNKHAPPAVAAKDKQEPIIVQKPVEQTIPVTLIPSGAATPAQQPEKQTPPLQQPDAKPPPQLQHQQVPKIDPKTDPLKQEPGKPQQQLPKGGTSPAKAVSQPQAKPPKQSVGFFGFGGAKSQPSQSKPEESVSGKMFGFGSSIFSSASTLITSAVQDEPHTTLPASPMVSAPASPMMTPAKETKPHAVQNAEEKKAEQPQQAKVPTLLHAKVDQPPLEPPKGKASSQPALKAGQSTCPLCKVELNIDSKDPPNYNTCTECKNTVCNLCGFNPMPHETEEWLCLNCQTQRALSGQLGDMGMMAQPQLTMTGAQPTPQPVATSTRTEPLFPAQPAELPKPVEEKVEKPAEKDEKPLKQQNPVPVTVPERVTPQPVPTADTIKKEAAPLVEKVDDVLPEPQQILTEKETGEASICSTEENEPTADSLLADQVVVEVPSSPASPFEADTKTEDHSIKSQDGPDILPISQGSYSSEEELKELQTDRNVPMIDTTADTAMPSKEEVNVEKRRLNYVQMEESSGSEPSPSPQVQRRRLSAIAVSTAASSSSEDYKADSPAVSPDSSVDEEEFIRRQIMGMTGEEEMFLSEEEKDEKESIEEETKEAEVDNESGKSKLLLKKGIMDNEDSPARRPSPGSEAKTTADRSELTTTVFKKDMALQRTKSTDDGDAEVESITESLEDKSKGEGSSSVQVSSFTPGTSPTSASSLEEDSDSSPSHKRSGEGKQHRKAKHRQAGQSLPTIEDSSEEEELREEEDHLREQEKQESDQQQGKRSSKKSKRDKDELQTQRKWDKPVTSPSNLSPIENASPTVEMRQAREMEVFHKSSGSDYSPSMESDSEAFHTEAKIAVPKGQKFSTAEPLKNAEDIYEEMLQKARSPKGETEPVPEIEPLYGGMAIEDYLYESLVEEPEAKPSSALPEQSSKDHAKEPGKKSLRSPEEVYEEIMLKKKELMLIEQEFQRAQSAMDTPTPEIHVTAPSSAAAESCKVGEAEGEKPMLDADSTYVKRKKRPAPPRPSEPPKRPEVYVAKPTVPQDMTMRRALFPIPDLKITQCSSGEDETDDSIIEEYGVGVSSDITPSDESETKEQVESSPVSEHTPIIEAAEIEPIIVVCEVPQAKATPAPAPETVLATSTTTTTSPISPVSPPTSPATPDSSLASNATSSSSFQAPSPLSSDSTPVSTPTPDLAKAAAPFAAQLPADISPPSIAPIMPVSPTTVLVTIPDVVTDPTQAPTPATTTVHASAPLAQPQASVPASVVVHIPDPVVIQMPDLVTSPSQMSVQGPPSVQVTAPTPVPSPVPSEATSPVPAAPSAMSTSATVSAPTPAPAPVVVQMPDLVTITSSVSPQAPLPVTSSAPAQATVVHSVPVQTAAPPPTPVVVPAIGTRRIQRQASTKKAPPPPPPRSTSVSLPQTSAEPTSIRAIHNVSPTVTTTIAMGAALPVVVNVQSLVEDVRPEGVAGSQVMMTPTRQGHVVIIVPNVKNMSVLSQTTQDLVANSVAITTTSAVVDGSSQIAARPVVVSVAPFYTAPSVPAVHSSDTYIPLADTPTPPLPPPPPPATLQKPAVYPKKPSISIPPSVPTSVPVSAALTMAQATVTTSDPSPVHKAPAPPPVPPKPVSIPAGLVFSHRPGESVKPPVYPTASHTLPTTREVVPKASSAEPFTATTLPRTREPPNALSLSLTTPVESKMSATSPRSPLSPRNAKCLETYVVITLPSEPGTPTEGITVQAPIRRGSILPSKQTGPGVRTTPSEQQSPIEAFSAQDNVRRASVPSLRQLPSLVTQVVTTEVQRTTVSVVHERLPQAPASDALAILIQPDLAKVQPSPKQNGKIYSGDAIDLRTIKVGVKMTDSGMDLTPQESSRQSVCSNSSGRHTAVQPEIVNLSAEITPSATLAVVTDSITIVTCSATIASYTSEPEEKPLDLQGYVASMPLPLTTYKPFEPLAQIVYRRVDSPPIVSTVIARDTETPINLSYGASTVDSRLPVTMAPAVSNGGTMLSELAGAVDLSTSRPLRAMVALSGTSPGVVTTVVEDDGTPIDLTAGKNVCCDVIYKLPFTGSCRTQPPVITQPDHFSYRDDHYQYDHAGVYGIKVLNGKAMSETNLADAGLFLYNGKTEYDYNGVLDSAVDLTAGNISAGEALDYTSKAAGAYTGISTAPYSQVPAYSVFRSSDGMVYSSIAAPVPSTYAITTQPGSIFSTTLPPTTTLQEQPAQAPYPYGFIPTTDPGNQIISLGTGLPKDLLPSALADIMTGFPALYSDQTLEAIAASLEALASLPMFPGLDDSKITQYQMEREFLQLEKLKQLCLAEELEWERQEIQRYREQEQIMVQRELEELQALKQKLLVQQEEEHQAHLVAQQETYNQQREQLEQIQQLQVQLQHQLEEHYGTTGTSDNLLEAQYAGVGDNGQYWPVRDESTTSSTVIQLEGGVQYVTGEGQREVGGQDQLQFSRKQSAGSKQPGDQGYGTGVVGKRIVDSGVQTDDEDSVDRTYVGRRKRNNRGRGVDSSVQTDDEEDQEDGWDMPTRSRRRSRSSKHSGEGKHSGSKVSSIAIQTVAEISVQTDHSGSIKCPSIQMDTKVEIIKHISAPENSQRGGSLSCQTDTDRRRHLPVEVGYSAYLKADLAPKSPKVLYSPVSPLSPSKAMEEGQKRLTTDPSRFSNGPRMLKPGPKSLPDPKSLSPTTEDRIGYHHTETYSGQGSPSGTGKKVKRTLPNPPPEDDPLTGPSGYSANSARRRLGRHTTMARAKILQDIDKELDLVERESSKLRRKQAELDEEEKEIDAKLRYLEMGINRRKDALLQEREKRERAYLQGVAEERDYMSDSEVSNIRETRGNSHGLERPRTAPQSEFDQFIPPETEADSQYPTLTSPYSHYTQYVPQTQAISHYPQQTLYQQQALYQQHPYQSQSVYSSVPSLSYPQASHSHQQAQSSGYQSKNTTNYEVIRNQPMIIVPSSSEGGYGVGKYGSLELRMGLEERSMASSPMSSISAESFYADIDHHNARNYVLIEDIEQLTKGSTALGSAGLGSGFSLPDKDLSKADRLLRAAEARRTAEVAEFLGNSRLHSYGKGEEDSMEEPYELKLLKQQIKQEFRRGTEGLEHLSGLGMPQYLPTDPSYRHFPKADKYSISRLTLEKQAAKQLPAAVLYQKQIKNQKKATLMDPKITKFSSIQESRDLEPDYSSFLGSGASSVTNLSTRARLLQDEITFGLRKNLSEQQKYLDSSLGSNLSLGLGGPTMRTTLQDDTTYPSGTRSRPSSRPNSRPTSVYGLDLSIKRDLSSSSLRLKIEGEALDAAFGTGVTRTKPTSLPISQSRGRIPIVAQNSEEESPLSPVGEPMGMARASAGPLPPISADSRDQFGSSHSLPEVQQHMREESRATLGHSGVYDRDIAFIMDDLGGAMSDSEAYHLRREDTDWFDKPAERQHQENGQPLDRRQVRGIKLIPYVFPHTRLKLQRDPKDTSVSGNGLGIRVVGGKEIPGCHGEIGAYIAKVTPGGVAEQTGKVVEGMQVLELNGVPLMGKTYEEVQCIMGQPSTETELCVRLDLNMLSDPEHPQALENHDQLKPGDRQCSPGVDPKQLAAELQKFSQQQAPGMGVGMGVGGSSAVPSPGQPASPAINKKQRHNSQPHPITGEIQLQINYDRNLGNLIVHVLQARNLAQRDPNRYSDPFVKVYLLPGRGQVMVVQNASGENKRRTKYVQRSLNPEWNQTVIYKNIHLEQLKKKTLEVTVWDYDKSSSNDFLGEVLIDLSNTTQLDNTPRWLPLKEQSESIEHSRSHHTCLESPKNSVIKSRSHGIFPDPAKDMQMVTLEKSHSSPGSSKSSSEGQLRSHGPSRSQSKSSVTQAHLEDAGIAIAAAEAAVQQARLQPRPGHRLGDVSGPVVSSAPNLLEGYGGLDGEEGYLSLSLSASPPPPALLSSPPLLPLSPSSPLTTSPPGGGGKTQMMGEIKVALKKEVKQEGDQLVLEVLQCRNITYKFKSPDHLPDLYVKLYVVNVATQKRIIKKKTRVCRHDREPSFNETFRFSLNPTGHSLQLFLVSNGGKFMKKTLIGEAYIWLDKVDMRKRVVSWHKLLVNSTHNQS